MSLSVQAISYQPRINQNKTNSKQFSNQNKTNKSDINFKGNLTNNLIPRALEWTGPIIWGAHCGQILDMFHGDYSFIGWFVTGLIPTIIGICSHRD